MTVRFEVLSPLELSLHRESFALADPTLLDPTNPSRLYQGEWLELTTGNFLARKTSGGSTHPMFYACIDDESGYDSRALGKVSVIMNSFVFRTQLYDANHAPATIGAQCYVGAIAYPAGGTVKRMILDDSTAGGTVAVARVIQPATGGWLKAIRIFV